MKLPLFPLNTVLFPGMSLPLHIFEPRYRQMVAACLEQRTEFGVTLIRSGPEVGGPAEPYRIGTSALIAGVEKLPDGRMNIEVVGQERFRILALHHDQAYLTGTVEVFPLAQADSPAARHSARALAPWLSRYLALLSEAAETSFDGHQLPHDPTAVAYLAAIVAQIPLVEKQALLTIASAADLLDQERAIFRREMSLLRAMLTSGKIMGDSPFSSN